MENYAFVVLVNLYADDGIDSGVTSRNANFPMSYERVSYIPLPFYCFCQCQSCMCGASNNLGGGRYHFSNLPVRREKRELHFLKKLYTPYDVIPIRKPWNNGVGGVYRRRLMVSEYIKASSVNWPCHLSSLSLLYFIFLTFLTLCGGWMWCSFFPKYSPDGQKRKYECVFLHLSLVLLVPSAFMKLTTNLQKWPKKCLACICALPFSIPSMCCNAELVFERKK